MTTPPSEDAQAVVGIDLGTTNSVVASVVDGKVVVVRDSGGRALVPSAVAFMPNGQTLVGRRARARALIDPANTVFSAKRIIGRPWSAPDTQRILGQLPYTVVSGENEEPVIQTRAGPQSVIDIASRVLTHLRMGAEHLLGRKVGACIVTVPANFSDGQREATRRAAAAAGMRVLRVLNEPTAAACALGIGAEGRRRVVVFDLGGGTFDVTVLSVHDNLYEVLATGGEPYLGGDDFDNAIAEALALQFLQQHRVDLRADPTSRARLLEVAESVKIALSQEEVARGSVPAIAFGVGGVELALEYELTRGQFEAMIGPEIDRALAVAQRVLDEASILPQAIDDVALVGGSTLIPLVRRKVADLFGREPHTSVNPLEVVACGAAMQAHSLWAAAQGDDAGVVDLTGAALLMDITSHALGVGTVGDNMQVLIPKNTPIPCEGNSVFATAKDDQRQVKIRVCQGEHKRFSDALFLGELKLSNLRPAKRGETEVAVEFLVDANGILQVSARDVATGQQTEATLSVLGVTDRAG